MKNKELLNEYSKEEEHLNVLTHGFGLMASLVALPILIQKAFCYIEFWYRLSFIVYGFSLIILYAASTFYHKETDPVKRKRLKVFDHAAIFVLIAGSYTPFCLVALDSQLGWNIFFTVWTFAFVGILFKLFFTGKLKHVSTVMYVAMGWLVVFFIQSLIESLSKEGVEYLIAGGIFYTIGAILYSIKKIPYNHAIFHVFVLLGSICHFWAIYNL
ncbi:PAQR family membrane homeostasis protein TrhA [Tenacibaculum agarivorans]|uniref:PAQR family membrane homeostasis protein TrhA n=1 Tax=Tenacibaculum agarivorans TaxID=1908389 RepID=UPI00094B9446|nr:hemolysin III family protein [Tenacibaculum agarivorans]